MKKNTDFSSNFYSFFWHFGKKYKFNIFSYIFLFLFVSYTLNMFLAPYILKYFVDNIKIMSFEKGLILLFFASFLSLNFLIYSLTEKFSINGIVRASEDMRIFLFKHLLSQSMDYFNSKQSGDIISKINYIISHTPATIRATLLFVRNIIVSFFCFIVFFYYDLFLGFIVLFFFLLYIFIGFRMLKNYTEKTNIVREKADKIIGFFNDVFSNVINVKIFSHFRKEKREVNLLCNDYIRSSKKEFRELNIMSITSFIFSILIFGSILFFMVPKLLNGEITLGSFLFIVEITNHMNDIPSSTFEFMQKVSSSVSRINNNLSIIKDKIKIQDKKDAEKLVVNNGKIVFKGVNFAYDK